MKRTNIAIDPKIREELRRLKKATGGVGISVLAEHSIRAGLGATREKFLPSECREMAQSENTEGAEE